MQPGSNPKKEHQVQKKVKKKKAKTEEKSMRKKRGDCNRDEKAGVEQTTSGSRLFSERSQRWKKKKKHTRILATTSQESSDSLALSHHDKPSRVALLIRIIYLFKTNRRWAYKNP
jgi:hypothetical protein